MEGKLHKVNVQELLHQVQDPVQPTIGHDLTGHVCRMMSPAKYRQDTAGHVIYVGLGTGTLQLGEEGIDHTTTTTTTTTTITLRQQQPVDGIFPNESADSQTTLYSGTIFALHPWFDGG